MLAVTGIFGMAAHDVSRRVKELGIRVALGARRTHVLSAAVGRIGVLLGVGAVAGIVGALLAGSVLGRVVYEAAPGAPGVLAGTALVMTAVGICGSAIPALRALSIDPSRLMRED
jgi:ABC-type antimicrobial peptide transport system permease subunit